MHHSRVTCWMSTAHTAESTTRMRRPGSPARGGTRFTYMHAQEICKPLANGGRPARTKITFLRPAAHATSSGVLVYAANGKSIQIDQSALAGYMIAFRIVEDPHPRFGIDQTLLPQKNTGDGAAHWDFHWVALVQRRPAYLTREKFICENSMMYMLKVLDRRSSTNSCSPRRSMFTLMSFSSAERHNNGSR